MEIKYIWRSKLRPGTCWFLAVRYIGLAATLAMIPYHFMVLDHESCSKLQWMREIIIVAQELLIEVTLALRVLAMYSFNRWIFSGFATGICTLTGISLWAMIAYGKRTDLLVAPGLSGCHAAYSHSAALRPAAIWEVVLACDILVFVLTVRRAHQRRRMPHYSGSLMARMETDGTMYFGMIVLANFGNVLSFYVGDILTVGLLSWFTTNLSITLLCRLMLNLHEAAAVGMSDTTTDGGDITVSIRFTAPRAGEEE
ncbi:hypothetical protein FB45DRAFT_922878 [Roridomyces roridus]|uniref:Uncharacterized protein n=1 Tax=Roridomyces roridus TaxID=1738132 RepID=A0AAD7FIG8_9AGAR|nr:hypothetical protein FB45DRAFT_922878 [Roridomyces roridus]